MDDTELQKAVTDARLEAQLRFRGPADASLRASLSRVLGKNREDWANEFPDLEKWVEDDKPNFGNLATWLEERTWPEVAELLGGTKGLDTLRRRHVQALNLFRDEFAPFPDESAGPYVVLPANLGPGGARIPPLATFLAINHPATEGAPYRSDLVAVREMTAPLPDGLTADLVAVKRKGPPTPPKPPPDALEDLRVAIERGAVVLVSPDHFPKENWLDVLVYAWLADKREKQLTRATALRIEPRPISVVGGLGWSRFPRGLETVAALGGPLALPDPVEVNGETYANEPSVATEAARRAFSALAVTPRSAAIVPAEWLNTPAQLTLELNMEEGTPAPLREYLIETATRTAALGEFGNMAPKLLGFMFACSPITGRGVAGTLGELASWVYPNLKERRQPKDYATVGNAFVAIKSLRLVQEKPNGVRHPYDLFIMDYDLSNKPDAEVGWVLNPWLGERMKGGASGGFFLLNMSRWLQLPIQNPRLFPLALRLAAYHDQARQKGLYDPKRVRWIEGDRLAFECNTLPEGAAQYRAGKSRAEMDKKRLQEARSKLEADLDALKKGGLLGPWKKRKVYGKGFELLPVAPEDYAEACAGAAKAVRASKGKAGK